eukprot:scaffold90061_cov66-Phaeocystis_antarctica.AAC.3
MSSAAARRGAAAANHCRSRCTSTPARRAPPHRRARAWWLRNEGDNSEESQACGVLPFATISFWP